MTYSLHLGLVVFFGDRDRFKLTSHNFQRKHRERKENYILALEEEIQRLRGTVHDTQLENDILRHALDFHGIAISASSSPSVPGINHARVALSGPSGPNQYLQLLKTSDSMGLSAPNPGSEYPIICNVATPVSTQPAVQESSMVSHEEYANSSIGNPHLCQSSFPPTTASPGVLGTEFAGFQFVLRCEKVLLYPGLPS